jgi:hypothetical protein
MSVELIMWESDLRVFRVDVHPCFYKFMKQIDFEVWQVTPDQEKVDMINQLLLPYNARVSRLDTIHLIVFEFDHAEDLTQFVLTWS